MKERFTPSTPKKEKTNIHTERHFVEILTNAEKVNEGSNAYILKTKQETEHDAQALKLLKLYQRGEGQREANAQKKAFEIITNASSQAPEQYAKVPELYEVNEIKLDTNTKTKLENRGVKMLSNESECLSMEFIEGDDLATAIYREALKRKVDEIGTDRSGVYQNIDELSFAELEFYIANNFEFSTPGGKGATEAEQYYEKNRLASENMNKLTNYLLRSGFKLHPHIVLQIKNTLETLHKNGIAHRDAHLRNFMVKGSIAYHPNDKTLPETYIIDFGTATEFTGEYAEESSNIYQQVMTSKGEVNFIKDESILNELMPLTKSKEEATDQEAERFFNDLLARVTARGAIPNAEWKRYENRFLEKAQSGYFNPLSAYIETPTAPDKINNFITLLLRIKQQVPSWNPSQSIDFLRSLAKEKSMTNINRLYRTITKLSQ